VLNSQLNFIFIVCNMVCISKNLFIEEDTFS
jgi:hypothetical protein